MTHLYELTAAELQAQLTGAGCSAVEATRAMLQRIEATTSLGAYLHVDAEGALQQAAASDARRAAGATLGPLDGVSMGIKDIMLVRGLPATCGSKILENFIAPYDATVVARLRRAGVVVLGKQNMDEFAMGSSNEHSAFFAAANAWDDRRVPGGSSGGSATSVAAGSATASLGTDTGGSIRQPAGLCGIVGLKPTYGRVSRHGVVEYASSLDQVGPMTHDVADCARVLQAIAGADPCDATAATDAVPDYTAELEAGVRGMRLGIPREYYDEGIDPQVRSLLEAAQKTYERLGATLVDVSLPTTHVGIATYYIVALAEAMSNLSRYDGVRYGRREGSGKGLSDMYRATRSAGFGPEVKRRILLGTFVLGAENSATFAHKAQQARTCVRNELQEVLQGVDLLLTPTSPTPAFLRGEKLSDPMQMYRADVCTIPVNLAGLPAISLPCGFTSENLPVGQQLIGPAFAEARLLRVARAYEREHSWHRRRPS